MLEDSIRKTAEEVGSLLKASLAGNESPLYKSAYHLPSQGGKRMRPFMLVRSCELVGGKAAEALERLVLSAGLRREMGINGRKRVLEFYKWSECVDKMTEIYSRVYGEHKSKNH